VPANERKPNEIQDNEQDKRERAVPWPEQAGAHLHHEGLERDGHRSDRNLNQAQHGEDGDEEGAEDETANFGHET